MIFKNFYQTILTTLNKQKKLFPKFLKAFQKKKYLKINLVLLSLFFLTFPNQNYYQSLELIQAKPLTQKIDFEIILPDKLPIKKSDTKAPAMTARSVVVVDLPTMSVLYAKNPDLSLLPASTTKIMTALVAIDHYRPDQVLTISQNYRIGQTLGLKKGTKFAFKSLLYGTLVGSGNDAAYALAENYPGGFKAFVAQMNSKGRSLNLNNTSFSNVSGIEAYNHKTTAHDLAVLSAYALNNKTFVDTVGIKNATISTIDGKKDFLLENTNKLIGKILGVKGIKTGWTENAGECLVTYIERPEGKVLIVILGSLDRFGETSRLVDWIYRNFSWDSSTDTIPQ